MTLRQGQIIAGRYEIMEQLGAGGMAIVYKARDLKLDRAVTLKVLREEHLENEEFTRRFMVEARAVASLNHPNIVNIYDFGNEGQINYIVMEFIDGVTLKHLIDRKAPFSDVEALGVASQIASALAHAHQNGIVHRDIKPQNILVTPSGAVKVADFGIARSIHTPSESVVGSTLGSVHYFSPEQARGSYVDHKSDLYSLGIVMFEMVTGTIPFDGDDSVQVALMHVNEPLPDMLTLNPNISKSIESIILCLTQKPADARYDSADRLLADMRVAITTPDVVLGIHNDDNTRKGSWLGRYKIELAAVATAIAIIVLALVFLWPMLSRTSGYVKVPQLVGLDIETATQRAGSLDLQLETKEEVFDETVARGIILEQNYEPGGNLRIGDTISIVVSLGSYKDSVPDLTNIELSAAKAKLVDYDFKLVVVEEFSEDTPEKIIIRQSPAPNEPARPGMTITLTVSKGVERTIVEVPDLIGMRESAAKTALTTTGLVVGNIDRDYSPDYPVGTVISQTISGGRDVASDTIVGFVVSLGASPSTAPNETPSASERPDASESSETSSQPSEADEPTETTITETPNTEKTTTLSMRPHIEESVESFVVTVMKKTNQNYVEIYRNEHTRYDLPINVQVSGTGKVEFHMMIDGVNMGSQTIDFDAL